MAAHYSSSFNVNLADLAYMLKQIKIAEATSLAYTATPVSVLQAIMTAYNVPEATAMQLAAGLRTVDGTDNNLLPGKSTVGAADTLFPRLTTPEFINPADGGTISFGPGATLTNNNYANAGSVVDANPRIISNLIVDMSISNPAAIDAFLNNPLAVQAYKDAHAGVAPTAGNLTDADLQTIPNQSPDIGLSPGFNSWMTIFGQFFDHGLDLVTKGNNGNVYIPLQPDDPLYVPGSQTNFMVLTRATPTIVNGVPQTQNTTTPWIDQNQTYTSNASHQAFLREYIKVDPDGAGPSGIRTVATGRLLDGTNASGSLNGAIGNWAEVKAQALTMLGIKLNDFDVHNVPLLLTDQYGKFIPGPNGYAQIVMAPDATHATNWLKEGNPDGSVTTAGSIGSNHAFLNDIAHHADPSFVDDDHNPATAKIAQVTDADIDANHNGIYDAGIDTLTDVNNDGFITTADFFADDGSELTYDDEMLDSHFVTGDGRGNENIALSAVHSIFHSEHNRVVEADKATILASGDRAFINEWLLVDIAANAPIPTSTAGLVWDGERLFQAARFSTEMQYQHLVFEEFARRIQPALAPFAPNSTTGIDAAIVAEFAHTVYRFGHSMLTGTIDRLENDLTGVGAGNPDQNTLLASFLNPQLYTASGATVDQVNANLIRGLTRDVGNAIDEFVVTDLRSNLLGLPLDLAALNIARGRETGIPSLNDTRTQLYAAGALDLKPYTSWVDFAAHLKNPLSIINFIAAYGTHADIVNAANTTDMRTAAQNLVNQAIAGDNSNGAVDFLNGTGAYSASLGGLNSVDLWIGGLAEQTPQFGGMLGSTFNYVFTYQMQQLQDGDRLYYLDRTQGQNILNNLEDNTFSDLVMRNSDLGDIYSTHLSGALFVTPDYFFELDRGIAQENYGPIEYNGARPGSDPTWVAGEAHSALQNKITRTYSGTTVVDPLTGITHDVGGTFKFLGGQHTVVGGTEGNDKIFTDLGIDTVWGDGGNDYINAGSEADNVFGGEGDDIIEDPFGADVLRGNQGNDVISSAQGLDILFGDEGNDFIMLGQDASEIFAGEGDDFVLGGDGADTITGNEGNDWIEGGKGADAIAGDNADAFKNSLINGHDVIFNQQGAGDYDGESGDDIMGSGPGVQIYDGMWGFDWAMAKYDITGVDFDMLVPVLAVAPALILKDKFIGTEALSGWQFDDKLSGDNRGHVAGVTAPTSVPTLDFIDPVTGADHTLTQAGIDRIAGLNTWMQGARQTLFGAAAPAVGSVPVSTFRDGNILMGGDGNDTIQGNAGFDLIDGDGWLNVRIKIVHNGITYSSDSLSSDTTVMGQYAGKVFNTNVDGTPNYTSPAFAGASLSSLMLNGTINPGEMSIVREILTDNTNLTGLGKNIDTAVFQGTLGEYTIEGWVDVNGDGDFIDAVDTKVTSDVNGDGFISVRDRDNGLVGATVNGVTLLTRGALTDDTDLLKNIEQLQFADQTIAIVPVAPVITSNGGGATATISIPENSSAVTTVTATDLNQLTTFTYSLAGGADASKFAINATTGALSFIAAPNFEAPTDVGANNVYDVIVQVSDGVLIDQQAIAVTVTDVNEAITGGLQITSYTPNAGSTAASLTATNSIVGVPVTVAYQWQVLSGATFLNIAGANAATLANQSNTTVRVVSTAGGNTVVSTQTAVVGNGAINTINGLVGDEIMLGLAGNDTLNASAGNDKIDGGIGTDTYSLAATAANSIVNLTLGTSSSATTGLDTLISIENVSGSSVDDLITDGVGVNTLTGNAGADTFVMTVDNARDVLNGGAQIDTVNYSAFTTNLTINLNGTSTVTGSGTAATSADSITGMDSAIGGAGNDTITGHINTHTQSYILNGGAGNDIITGAAGGAFGDILIGGIGADTINTGAADDNVRDFVQFTAANEFGDTVTNFDTNGATAVDDQILFTGLLNTAYDDGLDNNLFLWASGDGAVAGTVNAVVGQNDADIEGLFLLNGVTTANLGNAALVSAAFNAEFNITGAATEDGLFVVDASDGNNFSVWQWVQSADLAETSAAELSLIGTFTANAAVSTDIFALA